MTSIELAQFGAGSDNPGMNDNLPKPRLRFRFSLRTMFVLVTMLSVPLSWVGYHVNWIRLRREMLELVQTKKTILSSDIPRGFSNADEQFPLSLWILGERPVFSMTVGNAYVGSSQEMDARAEAARKLFPEAQFVFVY